MRRFLVIATLMVSSALACDRTTRRVAGNFATDIIGTSDSRPGTWGKAGSAEHRIRFALVDGCRVRVLRVAGDVVFWPAENGDTGTAGVLWGLQTTAPDGSVQADPAADNTLLYVQDATRGEVRRLPVDMTIDVGTLEEDGVLVSKLATWLSTFRGAIHIEATWTVYFRYENLDKGEIVK